LLVQGYIVVAPEYRGTLDMVKIFTKKLITGREIGDAEASRKYMVDNYPFVDAERCRNFRLESWWSDSLDVFI
jgi:dipeptidyl aminopeptidase/acylaminoacyl peptidase